MATMRTFHVPLPDHLHVALRAEAGAAGMPATEIARRAIDAWLADRRHERLAGEIREYAEAMAGTEFDLDPELEAAGWEAIIDEEGRR